MGVGHHSRCGKIAALRELSQDILHHGLYVRPPGFYGDMGDLFIERSTLSRQFFYAGLGVCGLQQRPVFVVTGALDDTGHRGAQIDDDTPLTQKCPAFSIQDGTATGTIPSCVVRSAITSASR